MNVEAWQNFFVISGGASAALTGLVFVAVSLNVDRILTSTGLRKLAAQTLLLLMTPLIMSIVLVIPIPRAWIAGVLCIIGGALLALGMFAVGHGMDLTKESSAIKLLQHLTPTMLVCLLIIGGGVSLVVGFGGGLYWLVAAVVFALIGGVANAWMFVIRVENWHHWKSSGTPEGT